MSSVLIMMSAEYPEHCKILPQINDSASDTKRVKDGVKVPQFADKIMLIRD